MRAFAPNRKRKKRLPQWTLELPEKHFSSWGKGHIALAKLFSCSVNGSSFSSLSSFYRSDRAEGGSAGAQTCDCPCASAIGVGMAEGDWPRASPLLRSPPCGGQRRELSCGLWRREIPRFGECTARSCAGNYPTCGRTMMRWLFRLGGFEFVLFMVSTAIMVAGCWLLLQIALSDVSVIFEHRP